MQPQNFDQMLPLFQIITPRFKTDLDKSSMNRKHSDPSEIPLGPDLMQYRTQPRRKVHRRRHHLEVGVHKTHKKSSGNFHKHSFSANFPGDNSSKTKDDDIYYNIEDAKKDSDDIKCISKPNSSTEQNSIVIPTIDNVYHGNQNFDSHIRTTELILDQVAHTDDNKQQRIKKKYLVKENVKLLEENKELYESLGRMENKLMEKEVEINGLCSKIEEIEYANKHIVEENVYLKSRKQCESCINLRKDFEDSQKDVEIHKSTNKDLKRDLEMLKNVVYRLNVELERYQEKIRSKDKQIESKKNENHVHLPASWGDVNSHTLGPLLDAYQDALNEKDEIISNYQKEIDDFTGKLKDVIEENELLHKKLVEDDGRCEKNQEKITSLEEENTLLKEQKENLVKKSEILEGKIRELIKMFEQKVESMSRDYDTLHNQYHKTRTELSTLQGKYQVLAESVEKHKKQNEHVVPVEIHNESLKEYKRLLEDLKTQYESDRKKLDQKIRDLEQRCPDMENRIVELRAEKRELQINLKNLNQAVRKLQLKQEQTHANLLACQLAKETCRKQLQRAYEFSRDLVHEQEVLMGQLAEKQRENRQMQLTGTGFVSRLDSFRNQLKSIQKDASQSLDTVEHRMLEQDSNIAALKKKFDHEIEQLSKNLNKKDEIIASLQKDKEGHSASITMSSCLLYKDKTVAGDG